jgi:adenylosuccinate synthase
MALSYAITIGAIDCIALMHLDTLSGLKEIQICRAYKINGQQITFFPANTAKLSQAQAVYETVPGWDEDITQVRDFNDLPSNTQSCICRIEELTGKPVTIIGVGPKREQTIFR